MIGHEVVIVEAVRRFTQKPLNVHLMMVEPERYLGAFARAGADPIRPVAAEMPTYNAAHISVRGPHRAVTILAPPAQGWKS